MGVYLEDNPPVRQQFRVTRRATVTGAIVVHTAENITDVTGPDSGAEAVASFIRRRRDGPGSYHSVVDADSIVRLGRYEWEMFHESTGGNQWSLGLAFACQAAKWPTLPERWYQGALGNGALEAANMARWVEATVGITVPGRRLTPEQYRAGRPGFIGHADLEPTRRSDPGIGFPWSEFLARYEREIRPVGDIGERAENEMMLFHEAMAEVDELYRVYRGIGPTLAERKSWGQDLALKMFARGEDPRATLAFIEFALRRDLGGG